MEVEGYEYIAEVQIDPLMDSIFFDLANTHDVITGNDVMWHYMTTGRIPQQEEHNSDGRTKGTEKTTDQQ